MKNTNLTVRALLALLGVCLPWVKANAIGGDGAYFVQAFEDLTQYPESSASNEQAFNVEGQGQWLYLKAFQATNASYIPDGSAHNLRLTKNGSYVITPVLTNGVSRVTFDIGRSSVKVYTSTDGGTTWTEVSQSVSGKKVTATVGSNDVNRIKIANDQSKDADIDNLTVYAQTFESAVTVVTHDAADITQATVTLNGMVTKDEATITELGFVWSYANKEPTFSDNAVACANVTVDFSAMLADLRQGATIYYRAYAKYDDTFSFGETKSLKTLVGDGGQTVDDYGRYFMQDFEDQTTYPEGQSATDQEFYVASQGTWVYNNSFASTNSSYNVDGSTKNLRMPKSGSYVITPVLNSGVKRVVWNQMRASVTAYVSTDGGTTWTATAITSGSGTEQSIEVGSLNVNRIKLANDASKDADIDNLTVYAEAFGTPATVATGQAYNITKNSAEVNGEVLDAGDQVVTLTGIVWSLSPQPTMADNVVEAEDATQANISVLITGLKANQTVYYQAFALSNAGYAFGEVLSFVTAEATPAVVATSDVTKSGKKFRLGGIVTDDGGLDLLEVGVIYSVNPNIEYQKGTRVTMAKPSYKFSTSVTLEEATTYYICAYAITAMGTFYGDEKQFTTEDVPDQPDIVQGDIIWCSPDGNDQTADGSEQRPFFDLQKAVDLAQPGDRIWMKAGTYVYDKRINIDNHNGTPDAPIELFGNGGVAVLDFSGQPSHDHSNNPYQGVRLTSSYWHFYHIDITNASDNGLLIERNKPTGGSNADILKATDQAHDNLIEECNFYRNGDTGLQMKNLASFNRVVNCDSYLNCDTGEGDADGFAPKLSVGDGNYFYGCRAWANSDDGWDVFFKKDGGFSDNVSIILENCVSYKNGFLDLNTIAPDGNGNGFKCGSNQGAMNVYMNRCLAICNKAKGFDQNHNAGDIILNNCTGMTLKSISEKGYSYRIFESIASGHEVRLTNCIAINDNATTDKIDKNTGLPKPGEHGKYGDYGRFEVDETLERLTVTTCEFHKASPSQFISIDNHEELIGQRDDDGEMPQTTFAHLQDGSFLIDAGTPVAATTYRGIEVEGIVYDGQLPDLGAYEYDGDTQGVPTAIDTIARVDGFTPSKTKANAKGVTFTRTQGGRLILTITNKATNDLQRVTVTTAEGKAIDSHTFVGNTTTVALAHGVNIITINDTTTLKVIGQ